MLLNSNYKIKKASLLSTSSVILASHSITCVQRRTGGGTAKLITPVFCWKHLPQLNFPPRKDGHIHREYKSINKYFIMLSPPPCEMEMKHSPCDKGDLLVPPVQDPILLDLNK